MSDDKPELDRDDVHRYSRHLLLEQVGVDGQRRLKGASVLCIGAGGLGSPVLLYLAAAGVGRLGIVDLDVVETSNLQRQIIHGTPAVGTRKTESARARIHELNPRCRVDVFPVALRAANALQIIRDYDVVVDGTDNFPTRYLVNDACVLLGKPNVYGSIYKFEGQASVFNHAGGPNYRDLYPQPPPPGQVPACGEAGVLGILPGVIGGIQATEPIKILLGAGTTLSGRLLLYDALSLRFRELQFRRDPHAPPITGLIDYEQFCGLGTATRVPARNHAAAALDPLEVRRRMDEGWTPFMLDVRAPHESDIVQLPGTDLVRRHDRILGGELDGIPRDRPVLVYCRSGGRSARAAAALLAAGLTDVSDLAGGINAWAERVDPSLPVY